MKRKETKQTHLSQNMYGNLWPVLEYSSKMKQTNEKKKAKQTNCDEKQRTAFILIRSTTKKRTQSIIKSSFSTFYIYSYFYSVLRVHFAFLFFTRIHVRGRQWQRTAQRAGAQFCFYSLWRYHPFSLHTQLILYFVLAQRKEMHLWNIEKLYII